MRRTLGSFALVLCVASVMLGAPLGARAGYCDSSIVIFSQNTTVGNTLNSNAVKCDADNADDVDMRLINPGSDAIFVRYIVDVGASIPALPGFLDGPGFDHQPITLNRQAFHIVPVPGVDDPLALGFTYQTGVIALPGGAAYSGCLTATVYDPSDTDFVEPLDIVTFHTIDKTAVPTGC